MKNIKVLMVVMWLCLFMSGCGNMIKVPTASSDYTGADYETVIAELKKSGFENIEIEIIEDLSSSSSMSDGTVEKVVINDSLSFKKKESFPRDAKVIVTYHIIKKIVAPISSDTIQDNDYENIGKVFKDAGFINVKTEEVFDMDPDNMETDYINEVSINGETTFDITEEFPYDADVSVICHRPYEKYTVRVHVECIGNLFFSKYDIDILLNNEKKEQLEHGEEADYVFRLKEGDYTFIFANTESSSVKGTETVEVSSDMEISYKLSCASDKISVETVYIDRKTELGENEVKVEASASDYKYKNYKEIVTDLEEAGFTNVKTEVLYDIIWGITSEGESDKVTIGGNSDFRKGEVFAKDVEIIVTYHMLQEDDPKKTEEEKEYMYSDYMGDTVTGEMEVLTVDNCEELEELLRTEDNEVAEAFASKYEGRQIEFDGYVADVAHYSDSFKTYDTKFNYLIYVGDSGQEHFSGPSIQFRNVDYLSFNLVGDEPDTISVGLNLHIVAEVVEFNAQQGLLILAPISTSVR